MIDNKTIYGLEFYSQDHMKPGFIVTLTGEEIKQLIKLLEKNVKIKTERVYQGSQI